MANVVCVWELGANLGHLGNLRQIAVRGLATGHNVWLIAKDLANVHTVFENLPVRVLQAPVRQKVSAIVADEMLCFSQLISHYSYQSQDDLKTYLAAWDSLFTLIEPDVVFYDHSPLALAASWRFHFKKILIGNGFTLPPTQTPLFGVFPGAGKTKAQVTQIQLAERELLKDLIEVLPPRDVERPHQVADIYRQAEHIIRFTVAELDHYGERPIGDYVGVWPSFGRSILTWKTNSRHKVFAYLQPFPQLPQLLRELESAGIDVVLYCPRLSPVDQQKLETPAVSFFNSPADLRAVAEEVDFAITHGNHDTSVQLSLLGVPLLTIPRHQEQLFFALKHKSLGLGVVAYQDQPSFSSFISQMLDGDQYRNKAQALAYKYRHECVLDPFQVIDQILEKL